MRTQLLLLSLLLFCCEQPKKVDKIKKEITFIEFTNNIKQLKFPIEAKCEKDLIGSTIDLNKETIKKYGPENCSIYGKIFENNKYTAIMYLYPTDVSMPIIQTNNKNGTKISSLNLYEISCWEDESISENSWFIINKDLSIELGDSSTTFERDDNGEIIESTRTIKVRNRTFKINSAGEIIEQKKKNTL